MDGGRGARAIVDSCFGFKERYGITLLRAGYRRNHADRAGAGDDDVRLFHFTQNRIVGGTLVRCV